MRDARRTTWLAVALALLLCGPALRAQNYPNGLSTDSVDPRADAEYIREVRRRLDRIRTEEKRPTVALVLSGGGAKGAAQVGAIKYIEELGIPVDFVCGTSIGGLVGGMYALGYKADDLAELFTTQDWSVMLTDRIPPEYVPYSTKVDQATYLLTIPFWKPASKDPDRPGRIRDALRSRGREDLEEAFTRPRGAASLPSGYAYGFNVLNLLTSLSVGYQDSLSFSRLPIPFACVAGDMVSSNAKYWGGGSIVTAMRSTMSIPGLFDPVRTGGMVLVDGGVRNNFPTDVAKAVGADLLIGIELSDIQPGYEEIDNLGNILGQFISMLGRDSFNKNVGKSDVFIKPELGEFNMLSFNRAAVDSMLMRGYAAAAAQRDGLLAIRERTGSASAAAPSPRATDLSRTPVALSGIEYEGLDETAARRMELLTGLDPDEALDKATIDEAMCRLQATGAFESVNYSLYGDQEPYRLVFHCRPAPVHSFSLGLRGDSEEGAALLFRAGLWANRLSGSKLSLTTRVGQNLKGELHYSLDLGDLPTLNLALSMSRYRGSLGSQGERLKYDVAYWSHREDFYITGVDWTRLDFRAGVAHKAYSLASQTVFAQEMAKEGMSLSSQYIGPYLQGNYYTLDAPYFPNKGLSVHLRADYDFLRPGRLDFSPVLSCDLDFRAAVPLGEKFTFLPDLRLRGISHFGEKSEDGLIHTNFAGGVLAARYTEDQLPFFGINHVVPLDDYVVDATLELRYNPLDKLYLSALAGVIITDNEIGGLLSCPIPDIYAFGMQAAYDTFVGPVRFNLHWSDSLGWGAYLGVGFDF
ncbi:MAG: hypothetical protein GXY24_03790 [Bacteroidales bacterium]|nr:hypothetical protein [Bacteroidales bacterium]